jgi:GPH family glycoside/pentoside/hexuronide:cation symporter
MAVLCWTFDRNETIVPQGTLTERFARRPRAEAAVTQAMVGERIMREGDRPGDLAPRLSLGRVVSYGAGDFAFNLSFTFSSLFLLYFYTDVLGLNATTAGLVIMVALVWEGITDPIIGMIANRTRSRWGRYRPYLLFGAIPLALSVVAMFAPPGLSGSALIAYVLATHLIYRTIFGFVNIPYVALSAQMTRDSDQRGQLAGARMIFAILCGLTMGALTLPLAKAFGGGRSGFFGVSMLYSTVATVILLLCFATTGEAVEDELDHPSVGAMIRTLRLNRPFLVLLVATVLGTTGFTMSGKALVYYLKYYVGSEAMVTAGLVATLGTAALAIVPWMMVTRRTSKRVVWLAGASINVVAYLTIFLFSPRSGPSLWLTLVAIGIGNSAFTLTFWSMLPDTVEYGEWKTGSRSEGAIFGLISFTQKIAFGLGTGLIGVMLDHVGYIANRPQSARTLHGITTIYGLGPLLLFAGSAIAIIFYPSDGPTHRRLVRAIAWRRASRPRG